MPVGFIWRNVAMPAMPQTRDSSELATLSEPTSRGYRSIAVGAHMHANAYPQDPDPLPGDFKIELTRADGTLRALTIDSATLHFRDTSVPGSAMSATPMDADALTAWLKSVGVQGEAEELNKEMAIVMKQVDLMVTCPSVHQMIGSGEFGSMGSSSGGSISPLPWVGSTPLLVGLIVWGIGIARIALKPSLASDVFQMNS